MLNIKTEPTSLSFDTGRARSGENYYQQLALESSMCDDSHKFINDWGAWLHDHDLDRGDYNDSDTTKSKKKDDNELLAGIQNRILRVEEVYYGRPFELYFKYGTDERYLDSIKINDKLNIDKSGLQKYVSCHAIINPNRQHLNWKLSQARLQNNSNNNNNHKNKHTGVDMSLHSNGGNSRDPHTGRHGIAENLDKSVSSLGVFITVKDPIAVRKTMPQRPCCLYFVINATCRMYHVWDEICGAVKKRISNLRECDAFGICLFNEVKNGHNVRHFSTFQDDVEAQGLAEVDDDDDSNTNTKPSKTPNVYAIQDWTSKYIEQDKSWRDQLRDEVEQWLLSHYPYDKREIIKLLEIAKIKATSEQKKRGVFDVNISTPLFQTLFFLEHPAKVYKKHYFKQIVFIHHDCELYYSFSKLSNINEKSENTGKKRNKKSDNYKNRKDDKILGYMKGVIEYGASQKDDKEFEFKFGDEELYQQDLCEQDIMNKISFFYSNKAPKFLNIEPFSTRIYTIGLGDRTNFAFLEYLSRSTRAFCKVKFFCFVFIIQFFGYIIACICF